MTAPADASPPFSPAPAPPVWDGAALLGAIEAGTERLLANRDAINALNVFPVPDGDTGTNMGLTMRAAVEEGRQALAPRIGVGVMAARIAFGALMGARGNSGVILSQVFRGVARAVEGKDEVDGRDVVRALAGARDMAYKAVMRPVEGTMLTVVRRAAERAEKVARRTPTLAAALEEAVKGAADGLASTPDLLDVLRQAGVVDAGGRGLLHILEGMAAFARGEALPGRDIAEPAAVPPGQEMAFLDRIEELHGLDGSGYCTNFVVFGDGIDFDRARADLAAMGGSAVIVGDDRVLKVHLHAANPGQVLEYALALGELDQIRIDNMQAQTRALTAQRQAAAAARHPSPPAEPQPLGTQAIVAVAAGEGLAAALRSLGASGVVAGGQTMNPSIEELLAAVAAAPSEAVILLPNNPNIVATANQVPALAAKRVAVVPSRSVPQGLAALAAFNPGAGEEENVRKMTAALSGVRTIEITQAVRDACIDRVAVAAGQAIGLLDDRLVASGEDEAAVAAATLLKAGTRDAELVTIFAGQGVAPEQVAAIRDVVATNHPGVEIEVLEGGQPHYRFIIAVE